MKDIPPAVTLYWQEERIKELEAAIRTHNKECQDLCGRGEQEAVRCQYRPYFENNGRRCPECPTQWKINVYMPEEER